jgi:DNA-directed RNA polymerase subunit RPC12/RpoP
MQTAHTAALNKIRELEEKVADIEAWERTKERYELQEITPGTFAYSLKKEYAATEPPHRICPNCYAQRKRAILQRQSMTDESETVHCQACGSKIIFRFRSPQPVRYPPGGSGEPGSWMSR